jgi:hypothetical protein
MPTARRHAVVTVELTIEEINALWSLVDRAPKTAGELVAAQIIQARLQAAIERAEAQAKTAEAVHVR